MLRTIVEKIGKLLMGPVARAAAAEAEGAHYPPHAMIPDYRALSGFQPSRAVQSAIESHGRRIKAVLETARKTTQNPPKLVQLKQTNH